jgi:hypothetical protein
VPQPWERGQGIPNGAFESATQYQRFSFYRDLGVGRTVAAAAKRFGVSWQAIHRAAKLYRWHERAAAFDQNRAAPGPVAAALARLEVAPAPIVVNGQQATFSCTFRSQEEFRRAVEELGRKQMATCQGLTAVTASLASHLEALVGSLPVKDANGKAVQPLEAGRSLREAIGSTSRALQAVSSAAAQMGTVGRENWGQAVGIEMLLAKFE